MGEFASRITGSSDLYQADGRHPIASINFVTAHDGFTLRDLVSYNEKHNLANLEDGRDGENHNRSWNCGIEGATDDHSIRALRHQQQRNFLMTLILSQGVPMLGHGDEFGRTQGGNNNAYCQDNEVSWVDWDLDEEQTELLRFTERLTKLRREHPIWRRRRFFRGQAHGAAPDGPGDLAWFTPGGDQMGEEDWTNWHGRAVMVFLNGELLLEPDRRGRIVTDDSFLLIFNAHYDDVTFRLPPTHYGPWWTLLIDTTDDELLGLGSGDVLGAGTELAVAGRSMVLLQGTGPASKPDPVRTVGPRPARTSPRPAPRAAGQAS
jgi:glycogen operon protein